MSIRTKQNQKKGPVENPYEYSKKELDFAYLLGVLQASGIDGLHEEIVRLKKLGKHPHDIIDSIRKNGA